MQPGVPHSHQPPVSMCPASATEANGVEFARFLSAEEAENNNGRMSMQTAANNNLVLTDLSSFKRFADLNAAMSYSGLYQFGASHLITGLYSRQVADYLGCRLVVLAECYYASRKMGDLEKVSQILVTAPEMPRLYENIGKYYQALCIQGFGRGDVEGATRSLEHVAENGPPAYRARAMQSLGTNSCYKSDYQSALLLYREAARFASREKIYDPYALLGTHKMAAVICGLEGIIAMQSYCSKISFR